MSCCLIVDSQVYHLADEIDDTYYSVPQGTQAQEVEPQSTEPADYKVPTNNTAVGGSSLYDSPRNNTAIAHSDSVYDSPRNNQAVGAKDNNIYYLAEDEENTAGYALNSSCFTLPSCVDSEQFACR